MKTVQDVMNQIKELEEQNETYKFIIAQKMDKDGQFKQWLRDNEDEIEFLLNVEVK